MFNSIKRRIFIFDPCFGEITGHWENYCKRLYLELKLRNYPVTVYGQYNYNQQITKDITFVPLFKNLPFLPFNDMCEFDYYVNLFAQDLDEIDKSKFVDGDLLIFHSIFPQSFAAIVNWIKELNPQKNILTALFFQFPPSEAIRSSASFLKRLQYWKRDLPSDLEWIKNNNVICYQNSAQELQTIDHPILLFTSTDILSKNFSSLLNSKVINLPMPGPQLSNYLKDPKIHPQKASKLFPKIKIGYFGHSAFAKGGHYLPYLVKKTLRIFPQAEFILHINPNPETQGYLNYFQKFNHPQVTCHFGHLGANEIINLMTQVDIILLPYSPEKYATTPSAVFTEGMALQKILIIPENTWMWEEAKRFHTGFVSFKRFNKQSIFNALFQAFIKFNNLREKSLYAGIEFHNLHNIENYTNMFFKVIDNYPV